MEKTRDKMLMYRASGAGAYWSVLCGPPEPIHFEVAVKKNSGPKNIPAGQGVDPQLMEAAKKTVFEPKAQETFACNVCDTPGASDQSEGLCWVCRRLKISAWKESEQQMMFTE